MATLSVLRFADTSLGEAALPAVEDALQSRLIALEDAALIAWPTGSYRPEIRQLFGLDASHPLSASFWHLLVGNALMLPVAARILGQTVPDCACSLATLGIDDPFVRGLRTHLVSGTSGLALLTADATADRVVRALRALDFSLLSTNLTRQQQGALITTFGATANRPEPPPGTEHATADDDPPRAATYLKGE